MFYLFCFVPSTQFAFPQKENRKSDCLWQNIVIEVVVTNASQNVVDCTGLNIAQAKF